MKNAKFLVFALVLTGASMVQATPTQDAQTASADLEGAWADPAQTQVLIERLRKAGVC